MHDETIVPIYNARLIICHEDYRNESLNFHLGALGQTVRAQVHTCYQTRCVMIRFKSLDDGQNGVIAHEALHAAWQVLHMADVYVDRSNHEAMAYLVQYIVDRIHKVLPKLL